MRRGWKVVRELKGGTRVSAVMVPGRVYNVLLDTRPRPNAGPLTVFSTREAAMRFRRSVMGFFLLDLYEGEPRVFRCLYAPSRRRSVYREGERFKVKLSGLPRNTRLAEAVRLVSDCTDEKSARTRWQLV